MYDNKKYEHIHRYLLNDMSTDERQTFEAEISDAEGTQKEIDMEKRFLKTLDMASDDDLRRTIGSVHLGLKEKGFFENKQSEGAKIVTMQPRQSHGRVWALAAALALAIGAWLVFKNSIGTSIDTEAVFAAHYQPERILTNEFAHGMVGNPGSPTEKIRMAVDQYLLGEFAAAKSILTDLKKNMPTNDTVGFYLALNNLELQEEKEAIELLEAIHKKDSALATPVSWYLGLAYLKNKNTEAATNIFKKIQTGNDATYAEKAANILKALYQ